MRHFWYHQNAPFDAEPYGSPQKQHKVFNTLGGSLGGPAQIPRIYDGQNKTFFFADYEGTASRSRCWTSKRFFSALALSGRFTLGTMSL